MRQMEWLRAAVLAQSIVCAIVTSAHSAERTPSQPARSIARSPIDLVLTPDNRFLVTANQSSDSISLVDIADRHVVAEVFAGDHPAAVTLTHDGSRVLVSGAYSGDVTIFRLADAMLHRESTVPVGFEPHGIAVDHNDRLAYVALAAGGEVAVIDIEQGRLLDRIAVGRWPRYLALSPDGSRLAVGTSGDRNVEVIDTTTREVLYAEKTSGINLGHMQVSSDGKYVYFPWMIYRQNPINPSNIRRGWVLASRIARVRLDGPARREAISLDPRGAAVSDPYGLALSSDEEWLVASAGGTHELLVYRTSELHFEDYGGPGDHIDPALLNHPDRFFRVPLGGRPMGLRMASDDRRVFVSNYLTDAVDVVDLDARRVAYRIPLDERNEPRSLARRGEAIFFDGQRSLDQWYSCHSCHYEGETNAVAMDTWNDGTPYTFKTVLSLRNAHHTPPWTWHGWQEDLEAGLRKSLVDTMQGPEPSDEDVAALAAYLDSREYPPNPFRTADGGLTEAAERGQAIFESERAGCATCHAGPHFTDGEIHDVGTSGDRDAYEGYNTPSLVGVYRRVRLLHSGGAQSLEALLRGPHAPERVAGTGQLTDEELRDLAEYLKSL